MQQAAGSLEPAEDSLEPAGGSLQQAEDSLQPAGGSLQQAGDSLEPVAETHFPLGESELGSTQVMIDSGSNHSHSSDHSQSSDLGQSVATNNLYNNGAISPWMGRFSNANEPTIQNNPDDPKQCYICCDQIEENQDFYSSDRCGHVLCEEHVWQNMTFHSFPDKLPTGKSWQMKKTGMCGMRCCPEYPHTWYLPNYVPFRPPNNEEYPHGVIVHYSPNQEEAYRRELADASTSYDRRMELLCVGNVKSSEMRIRSLEMWNTLVEIYAPDEVTYDFIQVPPEMARKFVVEVHMIMLEEESTFVCGRCDMESPLESRVLHTGCRGVDEGDLPPCANYKMCLSCACTIDNDGRRALLALPASRRHTLTRRFKMNQRREVYWTCTECSGAGLFRRLDGKVLNHVRSGRYGIRGFNVLNAQARRDVGDRHMIDDLPMDEDPETVIVIE